MSNRRRGQWDTTKTELDYYIVDGTTLVRYLGQADQMDDDDENLWTVKRFTWATVGGGIQLLEVQVLGGVEWINRASLPWT